MEEKNKYGKAFLIGGLVLLVAAAFVVNAFQNKKQAPKISEKQQTIKEIKIAQIPLAFATSFPLYVAQTQNFFGKYNLKAKFVQIDRAVSIQAMLAKEVDYAPFVEEGTAAGLNGAPVKTVMFFSENASACIVIRPGIELKDAQIVLASPKTWGNYITLNIFKEMGISPKAISGNPKEAKAMLKSKVIDAAVIPVPTSLVLREEGFGIVELFDKTTLFGLVTTDDMIKNDPEQVKGVVKAIQSAIDFIQNNPEKTKELLFAFYEYEKTETNTKIVNDAYAVAKKIFKNIKTPNQNIINEMIQIEKSTKIGDLEDIKNQIVSKEDIAKTFDFRFLK